MSRIATVRSVVLAACDGQKYIAAQLSSILGQLADDDEVLVSDDCSCDETVEVVRQFDDRRIKLLRNSIRVGYVENFQRAIAASRGDRIFFSDQDDIWLPRKVAAVSDALERNGCVVSDAVVVDDDLKILHPSYFAFRKVKGFSFMATFLRPRFIGATMACRREFLDELLPFPERIPHDFWLSLNAIASGDLEVIREPLILYRRHAETTSTSATSRKRPIATRVSERLRTAACMIRHRITEGKRGP